MNIYNLYRDKKFTNWYRQYYKIEANTLKEAVDKIINEESQCTYDTDLDCIEDLEPYDNSDYPTVEIYSEDDKILWDNVDKYDISSNKE